MYALFVVLISKIGNVRNYFLSSILLGISVPIYSKKSSGKSIISPLDNFIYLHYIV